MTFFDNAVTRALGRIQWADRQYPATASRPTRREFCCKAAAGEYHVANEIAGSSATRRTQEAITAEKMIFTLHRYILRELLKVFVLASIALTLILSLGSILQPVQQEGVGPRQVLHLIVYFLPITLTFVLPMAALFASALVYGRFASDNELDACKASGVSLSTAVYPGLALAIAVAIANLLLSFHVMPYFVHLAEKSLKADAKQILFRNIQRRGYYRMPDKRHYIYADDVDVQHDTLLGVVVVETHRGAIKRTTTAERAKISIRTRDQFNEVHIDTYNINRAWSANTTGLSTDRISFSAEFGSLLGDAIKFKKVKEMKAIRADLSRFYPIAKLARETYAQVTAELVAQEIRQTMKRGEGNLYRLYSGVKSLEFAATNCEVEADSTILLSGKVLVEETDLNGAVQPRRLHCARAKLTIEPEEHTPTLAMDIDYPRIEGSSTLPMRYMVLGLVVPPSVEEITCRFKRQDNSLLAKELAKPALELADNASANLVEKQSSLDLEIRKTLARITSEMHSRLVFGMGCVPMILIGIGLGIVKRGGHLLTAFGASCIPAAVLIVCIMSGKNIAENLDSTRGLGIVLMYGGLGFLLALAVLVYRRLLRN